MSTTKNGATKSWFDRIQLAIRGLTHCLEGYLSNLRSVSHRP
jgi:hypothetical protein